MGTTASHFNLTIEFLFEKIAYIFCGVNIVK